ncbi:MAG: glutamate synthase-related protein [Verrucomicrobiales bacterium]|nr:FMN-binding glutamate synthase family protein [Verrucomicrobiota bacterium JB025]
MPFFIVVSALLLAVVVYDLLQKKHAILRNFPLLGHLRYLLEAIGPELRQYIVTDNDTERPFSRDQRRWVYASSKKENNYFGFGTDNDLEASSNYIIIKHSAFPCAHPLPGEEGYDPEYAIPCRKVVGGHRQRRQAFRPASVVNVSGMSFGSLGSAAIEAINRGCGIAGCLHNTGEGGVSRHHLHGGELILQLGTAYFGSRDEKGGFSLAMLKETLERTPTVRAIEIKLSQGAKPGLGGLLPKEKITAEIALARGIPGDRDCVSPAGHTAFRDPDSLLDFIETVADATGLPVGIKSAVGDMRFWENLARLIVETGRAPDFINIDGGEGGTGAAPLVHADHVALPFKIGFHRVRSVFEEAGVADWIVWGGAGKLGFPEQAVVAMALGCDLVHVGREALLSIGCIQAQRCHTGHCPAGVATHHKWLMRGLDPMSKSARLANYIVTLRKELLAVASSTGHRHPAEITMDQIEILDAGFRSRTLAEQLSVRERG